MGNVALPDTQHLRSARILTQTLRARGEEEPHMRRLLRGQPGPCGGCAQPTGEELEGREATGPGPWTWLDVSSHQEGGEGQAKHSLGRIGREQFVQRDCILGDDLPRQGCKSGGSHWPQNSKNTAFQILQ